MSISYKDSGVDKEEGYKAVDLMKEEVIKTYNKSVLNNLGSFASLYELGNYRNPVLVSGTDGVGTKLILAFSQKKYNTIGIDAVAMCVNDILCHGAKPLFFLDYLGCGKLKAGVAADIIKGIATGCKQAGAALVGGETAEMPGFYKDGDYDIAGFCVGVVEKENIIDGSKTKNGDILVALPSSGVHSNGFSLIRKIITNMQQSFLGYPIWQELLKPTKIYVKPVLEAIQNFNINGIAHITGGGLFENLPRTIKQGLRPVVYKDKLQIHEIFNVIQKQGNVDINEMFNTFNMGVGIVLVINKEQADNLINFLKQLGETAYIIGHLEESNSNQLCLK